MSLFFSPPIDCQNNNNSTIHIKLVKRAAIKCYKYLCNYLNNKCNEFYTAESILSITKIPYDQLKIIQLHSMQECIIWNWKIIVLVHKTHASSKPRVIKSISQYMLLFKMKFQGIGLFILMGVINLHYFWSRFWYNLEPFVTEIGWKRSSKLWNINMVNSNAFHKWIHSRVRRSSQSLVF